MKLETKARKIHKMLEELYPETPIPLDHKDPYTLLIAVLLSAQCKDERVNKITPHLFKRADKPADMIECSVDEIEDIIRPCGLAPRKSAAIWELSQILLKKHGGEVPDTFEDLEALPGVGHKTASVVMAQAFEHPAFPVDTHIHRLARRWGLSEGKNVVQVENDLKALFPKDKWNKVHLQIIFFGREYCPARGHNPEECPICSWAGVKSVLDAEKKKKKKPTKKDTIPTKKTATKKAAAKTTTKKTTKKTTAAKKATTTTKETAPKKSPTKTTTTTKKTSTKKSSKTTTKAAPSKRTPAKSTTKAVPKQAASKKVEEPTLWSIAVGVVMYRRKVLMIKRAREPYKGLWALPGGKIEANEFMVDAAIREIKEETGLDVSFEDYLGLVSEHLIEKKAIHDHFLLHICRLKPKKGSKISAQEEGEVAWFTMKQLEAQKDEMVPSDYEIIERMVNEEEGNAFACVIEKKGRRHTLRSFESMSCQSR
ncbi:MAG: endonuclease III [Deltaproteobacteria bacterium]|nr:endonuclease III [Deltaproteobacteria bacterium]|tara:strand:+ start:41662 stop:43107 length:1446 start_codon:yes stop_codon:yes gene_type:complete